MGDIVARGQMGDRGAKGGANGTQLILETNYSLFSARTGRLFSGVATQGWTPGFFNFWLMRLAL